MLPCHAKHCQYLSGSGLCYVGSWLFPSSYLPLTPPHWQLEKESKPHSPRYQFDERRTKRAQPIGSTSASMNILGCLGVANVGSEYSVRYSYWLFFFNSSCCVCRTKEVAVKICRFVLYLNYCLIWQDKNSQLDHLYLDTDTFPIWDSFRLIGE